ncbi:MAG TPA: rhomboid family intramembrane serine protease [Mobilitalea sp.]|nr:rhomboid family intramembrane serine protease [Mobilitalea sp.]
MRIIDGLNYQLVMREFKRAAIHASGFQLFYRPANEEADIVIIFYAPSGEERTAEEYDQILFNIKKTFNKSGFGTIRLLGIILTEEPPRAKQFCLEQDAHWIIDLSERRLIIYENQPADFLGLRNEIELLLENENYTTSMIVDSSEYNGDYSVRTREKSFKGGWITLFNTAIIALNIIVFIIVHYSGIIGETDPLLTGGALNWQFIMEKGESYRIFTSMFLHSDFGHLMNNMIVLFFVGDNLERAAGKLKYIIIYFGSGIIAGLTSISYNMIKDDNVLSIGASGAIFGIVGAIAYIIAVNKGKLEDINARQIILFTLFSLYGGIMSVNTDNAAHIGGFLGGVLFALLLYRKPKRA